MTVRKCGCVAALCLSLIASLPGCERRPGRLLDSAKVSDKGMTFLLQRYAVAHYGYEREIVFWCTSSGVTHKGSRQEVAKSQKLQIDSDEWLLLFRTSPVEFDANAPAPLGLPVQRVRILSPRVAYVDSGPSTVAFTFDACRTKSWLSPVNMRQKLFVRGELDEKKYFRFEPPAFTAHRVAPDESGICLRLNPHYQTRPDDRFDVCTGDRGETWYVRVAPGDLEPPGAGDLERAHTDSRGPAHNLDQLPLPPKEPKT